jgi:cytochrome c-type biogenesis protein CcmH
MMIFLSASVMVLTLILLTRPLWQKQLSALTLQATAAPSLHTLENVEAYRARVLDLEHAVQAGRMTAMEKQTLEIELKRTLLTDAPTNAAALAATMLVDTGPQWKVLALIALMLVLITTTGYWHFGDYQNAYTWQQTQQRLQPQMDKALADPQVLLELFKVETTRDVVLSYQQSLFRSPENPSAWQALSRILQELEQPIMAEKAARQAYKQAPQDPIYGLELAQLIIESNQGKLTAESDHILNALQKDHPQDPRVLMLLGAAHLKGADWSKALNAFQTLQMQLQAIDMGEQGVFVKQKIDDYIAQSQQGLDGAKDAVKNQQTISNANTAATAVNLKVRVSLAPGALSAWKKTETLWVFAKVANGPRFPVAAKKMVPSQWPAEITLSDSDAMMPQYKLSGFDRVNITARLSEHDSVMGNQPGDWQHSIDNIDPRQPQLIELMLDLPKR